MILSRKLWLTGDRASVVEDGDKRAAYLLGVAGTKIKDSEASRLGIGEIQEPETLPEITIREPEIISRDPVVEHRDPPRRRGRPPKV